MSSYKNFTDKEIAVALDNLVGFHVEDNKNLTDIYLLTEAARRLRTGAGAGIWEVHEANKHLDQNGMLSDPEWFGEDPEDRLCFDLWAAIKAEVKGVKDD